MEVLYQGEEPIQADLVFVHGLRGDKIDTWKSGDTVWPRDLLKEDVPNARIMTYNYDASVMNFFSNTSQSSIFQHSINLLEDLQRKRRSAAEKQRQIIFIGHSLGGLVIKDALIRSNEYKQNGRNPRSAAIFTSTFGVIFIGTPHRGGNRVAWAKIATNLASVVLKDNNSKVIEALNRGSEVLERLQDSFSSVASQLRLFSFFEDEGYSSVGKIVDDDSASLGFANERKQWIPANHSTMCKFKSRDELGYERIAGAIWEFVEDANESEPVEATASNTGAEGTGTSNATGTNLDSETTSQQQSYLKSDPSLNAGAVTPGGKDLSITSETIPLRTNPPLAPAYSASSPPVIEISEVQIAAFNSKLQGSRTIIFWAIEIGPQHVEEILLKKPDELESVDDDGVRPLEYAFEVGNPSVVELLLSHGAIIDGALRSTAARGDIDSLKLLVNHGIKKESQKGLDFELPVSPSALAAAASENHAPIVEFLLPYSGSEQKAEALCQAAKKGNIEIIQLLLAADVEVDGFGANLRTALHEASEAGCDEMVTFLVERGADVDTLGSYRSEDSITALILAVQGSHENIVRQILKKSKKSINFAAKWLNQTALSEAVRLGDVNIVRILLDAGANVLIQRDGYRFSIPLNAYRNQRYAILQLLESHMSWKDKILLQALKAKEIWDDF